MKGHHRSGPPGAGSGQRLLLPLPQELPLALGFWKQRVTGYQGPAREAAGWSSPTFLKSPLSITSTASKIALPRGSAVGGSGGGTGWGLGLCQVQWLLPVRYSATDVGYRAGGRREFQNGKPYVWLYLISVPANVPISVPACQAWALDPVSQPPCLLSTVPSQPHALTFLFPPGLLLLQCLCLLPVGAEDLLN